MRKTLITAAVVSLLAAVPATGQRNRAMEEVNAKAALAARHQAVGTQLQVRNVIPPGTMGSDKFGFTVTIWGIYYPTAFPDESWLRISCAPADPRWPFDTDVHGFDLIRLEVVLMDSDGNTIWDTTEDLPDGFIGGGICSLEEPVDLTFADFPRELQPALAVVLPENRIGGPSAEAVEVTYKALIIPERSNRR